MKPDKPSPSLNYLCYAVPVTLGFLMLVLSYRLTNSPVTPVTGPHMSFPIVASIFVLLTVVWLLAVRTALRFKNYTWTIRKSKDGKSLSMIATAFCLLVGYIMLLPAVMTLESLLVGTPYLKLGVALGNHLPLLLALASGILLLKGSVKLVGLVNYRRHYKPGLVLLVSVGIAAVFTVFCMQFVQAVPHLQSVNGVPKFTLPVPALIFTYVIPHVALWIVGSLACLNIMHYAHKVAGVVYKSLFRDLGLGLLLVYICIFIAQFLTISSMSYAHAEKGLIAVYGVVGLALWGLGLIYRGSKKLQKIEDLV